MGAGGASHVRAQGRGHQIKNAPMGRPRVPAQEGEGCAGRITRACTGGGLGRSVGGQQSGGARAAPKSWHELGRGGTVRGAGAHAHTSQACNIRASLSLDVDREFTARTRRESVGPSFVPKSGRLTVGAGHCGRIVTFRARGADGGRIACERRENARRVGYVLASPGRIHLRLNDEKQRGLISFT